MSTEPRIKITGTAMEFQSAPDMTVVSLAADLGNAVNPYTLTLPGALGFVGAGKRVLATDVSGFLSFLALTDQGLQSHADASGGSVSIGANNKPFDVAGNAVTLTDTGATINDLPLATAFAFRDASDGAAGIVDDVKALATGASVGDTVANAFAKVDNWLYERVVGQPPAPTFLASQAYSSGFTIAWAPPPTYKVALGGGTVVPVMTQLNVELSGSGITTATYTTTQQTNMPGFTTPLTAITFTTNAAQTLVSPVPASATLSLRNAAGTTRNYSIIAAQQTVTGLATAAGPFTARIWYSNGGSGSVTPLLVANVTKAGAVAPSAPVSVTIATPTTNTLNITSSVPVQSENGTPNTGTSPGISNYEYAYTTVGAWNTKQLSEETTYPLPADITAVASSANQPAPRRSGTTFVDANGIDTPTVTTKAFTGLAFDAPYAVKVGASNSSAPTVITNRTGPIYSRTALPTYSLAPIPSSGGLTFTGVTAFVTPGIPVSNRSASAVTVIDSTTVSGKNMSANVASTPFALIHSSRPGISATQAGGYTSRFTLGVTGAGPAWSGLLGDLVTSYTGYGGSGTVSASDEHKGITVGTAVDAGTGLTAGFWMQAPSLSVALDKAALLDTDTGITVTLKQELLGGGTVTRSNANPLYFDTMSAVAVAGSVPAAPTPTVPVSGVTIMTNAATIPLSTKVDVTNMGHYFLPATLASASMQWNGATVAGTTVSANQNATLTKTDDSAYTVTTPIVEATLRTVLVPTLPSNNTAIFTGGSLPLTVQVTGNNIKGTVSAVVSNVATKPLYLDMPTNATLALGRLRVTSGSGTYAAAGTFGGSYTQATSLTGAYTDELQLAAGLYQTKAAAAGGYKNYSLYSGVTGPDYSGISASGMRYVTFEYPLTGAGSSYATLTFTGAASAPYFGADYAMNPDKSLKFMTVHVKIKTSGNESVWLDANTPNGGLNLLGANEDGFLVLNTSGNNATTTITASESVRPILVPTATGATAGQFYVRVGMDMSKSLYFKDIAVTYA